MPRARRPWLSWLVMVIALTWIVWLAKDRMWRHTADVQVRAPPPESAGAPPEVPRRPGTADRAVAPVEGRNEVLALPAPRPQTPAADTPQLQLAFAMPQSAQVGEGFDVRVFLTERQPIGRILVEVTYDPALLKARTLEEIDYAPRELGERMFRIESSSDGRVELSIARDRRNPQALPTSVPLVQFEALAPGRTRVRVESIVVTDPNSGALTWSATGRDGDIVLN